MDYFMLLILNSCNTMIWACQDVNNQVCLPLDTYLYKLDLKSGLLINEPIMIEHKIRLDY
jgi:hypothetical protein